ncbi:MAG: AgmX/PglI C-terminal domain-containing protein [Myxococcota bacterium]|jgi:hypothetical protein|nr:AgmX/PglI C-terminal domain-containing protein [Myxococcota bacterium]
MSKKITIIASFYGVSAGILITVLFALSSIATPGTSRPVGIALDDGDAGRSIHSLTAVERAPSTPVHRAPPTPVRSPAPAEPQKLASLGAMLPPSSQLTPTPLPVDEPKSMVDAAVSTQPVRAAKAPARPSAPTISEDDVVGVVRKKKGRVKACYEKELKSEPDLIGLVQVGWTVTSSGSVRNVKVLVNSTGNKDMEQCIERTIGGWNFPSSGASVDIEYPFKFRPAF